MPFTPAHPAIILPLVRLRIFSATALVAGSMAPDFEYFMKFSVDSHYSHTWLGMLFFDVPVAVILSLLFHRVVKQNLLHNLPAFLRERFQDTLQLDFMTFVRSNSMALLVSAAIGSASHLFWDSFTHANGFFVRELPFYKDTVVPYDGARYPLFYALQNISTATGLFVLILYIFFRKRVPDPAAVRPSVLYWVVVVVITALVVMIRFAVYSDDYIIGNLVVSFISGSCIALIIAGVINFNKNTVR